MVSMQDSRGDEQRNQVIVVLFVLMPRWYVTVIPGSSERGTGHPLTDIADHSIHVSSQSALRADGRQANIEDCVPKASPPGIWTPFHVDKQSLNPDQRAALPIYTLHRALPEVAGGRGCSSRAPRWVGM